MKNFLCLTVCTLLTLYTNAQTIVKIKADSVRIYNDSLNANLIIKNSTKDSSGFLYNIGNGRTAFKKLVNIISDSALFFTGVDSISIQKYGLAGGESGSIIYNKSDSLAATATNNLYWNDSSKTLQLGEKSAINDFGITNYNLDSIYAETSGISLVNTTAAAVGSQQRSPAIRFEGYGVSTTNVSRPIEINNYLLPMQNTSIPEYQLLWEQQRNNNATRTIAMRLYNGEGLMIQTGGLSFCDTIPVVIGQIIGTNYLNTIITSTPSANTFSLTASTTISSNSKFARLENGSDGFHPTSGNATHTMISIEPVINQTGTASGITRGVHINTLLESAPDYRAIEISSGKSHLRSIILSAPGDKINIATGTDASAGTATLASGTVTVNTSAVTADSKIFLAYITPSGTTGALSAPSGSISAGTSFVINSSSASDNSTVYYWIIN